MGNEGDSALRYGSGILCGQGESYRLSGNISIDLGFLFQIYLFPELPEFFNPLDMIHIH